MRYLVAICALSLSMGAFAKDINTTITEIEYDRSAQCQEVNSTMSFCLNQVCINYVTFQCTGNTEVFKARLKVVTKKLANGSYKETVKKVKYIK